MHCAKKTPTKLPSALIKYSDLIFGWIVPHAQCDFMSITKENTYTKKIICQQQNKILTKRLIIVQCDYSSNLKLHYARVPFLLQLLLASQTIRSSTIYTLQTSGNGELDIYTTIYSHMQWTHILDMCSAKKKLGKK